MLEWKNNKKKIMMSQLIAKKHAYSYSISLWIINMNFVIFVISFRWFIWKIIFGYGVVQPLNSWIYVLIDGTTSRWFGINFVFRRFMKDSLRQAHIVNRLIDTTLVGNFSMINYYIRIKTWLTSLFGR